MTWSGSWVRDRLGVRVNGSPLLLGLIGLAVRDNPRRAHLLVSQVLGKHVPQRPAVVHGAGVELGVRVRELLGASSGKAVVLGYAETATALGHSVADGLGAPYLHSTRRPVAGVAAVGGFEEEHSHATSHLLLPADPEFLAGDGPLVLVDDEFSTGRTVLNTIRALHSRFPRRHYVVAALVDLRTASDRAGLAAAAAELGARLDVVATASGTVELPDSLLPRARQAVAAQPPAAGLGGPAGAVVRVALDWPAGLPEGGRHGFTQAHREGLESLLPSLAASIAGAVGGAGRVLVLGFEELMYVPLRIAGALGELLGEERVLFSTTTRSPVLAVDHPGYPIRTRLAFPAHDAPADGSTERYAYNVAPGRDAARRFDTIVLVVDGPADTPVLSEGPDALLAQLRCCADRVVLAVLPAYLEPST